MCRQRRRVGRGRLWRSWPCGASDQLSRMSTVAALPADCANCGAALNGPYCQACGQKAASPNVSLHEFFHEAFHEFAHVDGKIVQTLRLLLTRPGRLTRDFLDGRRQRYVSPLRLYLTCSLIFFALASVAPRADRPFFTVSRARGEAGLDPERVRDVRLDARVRGVDVVLLPQAAAVLRRAPVLLNPLPLVRLPPAHRSDRLTSAPGLKNRHLAADDLDRRLALREPPRGIWRLDVVDGVEGRTDLDGVLRAGRRDDPDDRSLGG